MLAATASPDDLREAAALLGAARALLDHEGRWHHSPFGLAADAAAFDVDPRAPAARSWTLLGALAREAPARSGHVALLAFEALDAATRDHIGFGVADFDSADPGLTHGDVLAALDRGVGALRERIPTAQPLDTTGVPFPSTAAEFLRRVTA